MTARKNYNSVIFLTTLSVYLGLVLVGAPAPVLAQAALTGRIEAKDKVERQDDLDKKPDEEFEGLQEIYSDKIFTDFVKDLEDLQKRRRYQSIEEKDFSARRMWFANFGEPRLSETPNTGVTNLGKVLAKLLESLDDGRLRNFADFSGSIKLGSYPTAFNLGIYTNISGVKLETYFITDSVQKATLFANKLNAEFLLKVNKTEDNFAKQVYENTKVTSFNNQVFITTQLPRGSLDALLVKDGAK